MPNIADAFRYPLQGLSRFLVACLALPGVTMGILVLVAWGGLAESEGGDLMTLFLMAEKVIAISALVVAIPALLLTGYWLRAVREVARGATELPHWDHFGELLREGLAGVLVCLVVGVGPFVLCLAGIAHGSEALGRGLTEYLGTGAGVSLIIVICLLLLVVPPLWPLAMLRLALGRFVPLRWTYGVVLAIIYVVHLGVGAVLGWLPFLWLPVSVYFQLFTACLLGQYSRSVLVGVDHVERHPDSAG